MCVKITGSASQREATPLFRTPPLAPPSSALHLGPMEEYTLILLAGGAGTRMGGRDKGLVAFRGEPMAKRMLDRFRPPVSIISANRNLDTYKQMATDVVPDRRGHYQGPLAGLEVALERVHTPAAVVLPCDMPFLPAHLVRELLAHCTEPGGITVAHDGTRLQPLCMALRAPWPTASLTEYLDAGCRSVHGWLEQQGFRTLPFPEGAEAFANRNREDPAPESAE